MTRLPRSCVPNIRWLFALLLCLSTSYAAAQIFVNGQVIDPDVAAHHANASGNVVPDGRYWYDPMTGAWGWEGQGTSGFIAPGLPLGGPLREDASRGASGVYVNGRHLPDADVIALKQRGIPVQPGRWWVDAYGNGGPEGGAAQFNLHQLARRSARAQGQDAIYDSWGVGNNRSSLWLGSDGSLSQSTTINGTTYSYNIGD
ncbi:MAG: hypothetical protein R3F04_05645 [Lysobacteraceae bacterium]